MPQLRLFVSIELPQDVKNQLRALEPETLPGMRPTKPDNLHLTLHFIGDADPAPLAEALDSITTQVAPFDMSLAGVGCFGGRGRGLILWVGVEPTPAIFHLHFQLGCLLAAAGVTLDTRPYRPHITIARGQRSRKRDAHEFLELHGGYSATVSVDSVCLVSSVPKSGGSVYTIEKRYALAGA